MQSALKWQSLIPPEHSSKSTMRMRTSRKKSGEPITFENAFTDTKVMNVLFTFWLFSQTLTYTLSPIIGK